MIDMTPGEIDVMLDQTLIGRLCMADAQRQPYSIPLPFCWLDGALYVRIPLTGRKGQVLRENDRVCFEVDAFSDDLSEYASVLVEGRLIQVNDIDEKRRVKAANDAKYLALRRGHRPGHGRSTPIEDLPMRRILVKQVSGRRKETPLATTVTELVGSASRTSG